MTPGIRARASAMSRVVTVAGTSAMSASGAAAIVSRAPVAAASAFGRAASGSVPHDASDPVGFVDGLPARAILDDKVHRGFLG